VSRLKFYCHECGKEYIDADRKLEPFCECGARRLKASFGKIPRIVPSEIKDYTFKIFDGAEKAFGRTEDQLVYEKAFILLALLKFVCSRPEVTKTKDFWTIIKEYRREIVRIYKEEVGEFKRQGFRTPTSAMPGMAEEEMLGSRPNELKITMAKYEDVRARLMNLSAQECQNSIRFLEIQLKNKLYG